LDCQFLFQQWLVKLNFAVVNAKDNVSQNRIEEIVNKLKKAEITKVKIIIIE